MGPIGDDDEGAPWLQCGPRVCEKLMAVNEMNCVGESNRRDGTVMVRDRVQVVGRPEDPRDAALATVLIGCADEPERVRFRVHADDLADSTRKGKRQLAGAAADIDDRVQIGQTQRFHQAVDDGTGISAPIARVVLGDVALEPTRHGIDCRGPGSSGRRIPPEANATRPKG